MSWIDSLSEDDVDELTGLHGRGSADGPDVFFNYIILAISVRALGPIELDTLDAVEHEVLSVYGDLFVARPDGKLHLRARRPLLVVVGGGKAS